MKQKIKSILTLLFALSLAVPMTACNFSPDENDSLDKSEDALEKIDEDTDIELLMSDKVEDEAAWHDTFDFPDNFSVKSNFTDIGYSELKYLKFENMKGNNARYYHEEIVSASNGWSRSWYCSCEAGKYFQYGKFTTDLNQWARVEMSDWGENEFFWEDYSPYLQIFSMLSKTYGLATYSEEYNGYVITSADLIAEGLEEGLIENQKYILKFKNGKLCGYHYFDTQLRDRQGFTLFYNIGSTSVALPEEYLDMGQL